MRLVQCCRSGAMALVMTAGVYSAAAQGGPFRFTEPPGTHGVGLKVVEQYDYARVYRPATDALGKPYAGERARPLQTLVWYPAEKSAGRPMTVGDYIGLMATETNFSASAVPVAKPDATTQQWKVAMQPVLGQSLWSVRDAKAEAGRYPVVIYAPSLSSMAWENADLCEDLASHGYVVIASPDMGARTRAMTNSVESARTQAEDIEFLIGYARTLMNTDLSAIAVVGYSWGGISNLFAAAMDDRIQALVALDGSMRYFPGFVKDAGFVHPEEMTIPLLYSTRGQITLEEVDRTYTKPPKAGPSVLNAWTHGDLVTLYNLALTHAEQSAMAQRNEIYWKMLFPTERPDDYTREDGIAAYAWVARYTVRFLDAYLKHDAEAMAFLKRTPAENGAPPHLLTENFRAAKGIAPTLAGMRAEMARRGFDHAAEVYAAMVKETPGFKPDEAELLGWSAELAGLGHGPEAMDVVRLDVQIYPESSAAYVAMGDVYLQGGDKAAAVESYRKALEKNANDPYARAKLGAVEGGGK